jgi:hypothetical protein
VLQQFSLVGWLFVAGDFGFDSGSRKTRQWDNTGQFFGLLAGPKDKVFSLFFEFFCIFGFELVGTPDES